MSISNIVATTFAVSALAFSSPAFGDSPGDASNSATAVEKAKAMLATELPAADQFRTTPTGGGGSECTVDQPFSDNGETLATRVSIPRPSASGDIAATVLRHNDADGQNKHDQTIIIRVLNKKGKVEFELFANRADTNVQACVEPGGFMHTCNRHPNIGTWIPLEDPRIAAAIQARMEAALNACVAKHEGIQAKHDRAAELGGYSNAPATRVRGVGKP